jgi:Ku70/Ku80 beta-barrel domain
VPAVRPYWKGYIKLALVSCPIGLWTASSSGERVAFRQISKKTGNRLRQQLVDDETREPVEAHEKGRGYEYAKGSYLMIEDHELEAIEIESNHTIEIDSFVPRAEIDERFLAALANAGLGAAMAQPCRAGPTFRNFEPGKRPLGVGDGRGFGVRRVMGGEAAERGREPLIARRDAFGDRAVGGQPSRGRIHVALDECSCRNR